jgi:crotonobetainyl-CoA:carnitine CoA-transferase CaiB-like acyl-CoA transferase
MAERGVYSRKDGVLQAAPAPRFSATPSAVGKVPIRGEHSTGILRKAGLSEEQIQRLL